MNKKAEIGTTINWIVATIIIIFMMISFVFILVPGIVGKLVDEHSYVREVSLVSEINNKELKNNQGTHFEIYSNNLEFTLMLEEFLNQKVNFMNPEFWEKTELKENELTFYELASLEFADSKNPYWRTQNSYVDSRISQECKNFFETKGHKNVFCSTRDEEAKIRQNCISLCYTTQGKAKIGIIHLPTYLIEGVDESKIYRKKIIACQCTLSENE